MKKTGKENFVAAAAGIGIGTVLYIVFTFVLAYGIYENKIPEAKIKLCMLLLSGLTAFAACVSVRKVPRQKQTLVTWIVVLGVQAIIFLISAMAPGEGDREPLHMILPSAAAAILCSSRTQYRKKRKHHKYC